MKELICITCPRGCHLKIDDNLNVTGNGCNRGVAYAKSELTYPVRVLTSTVSIESVEETRLPVKTAQPIPKEKIFEIMEEINKTKVKAPIYMNDVVIKNILGLGIDVISTKEVLK